MSEPGPPTALAGIAVPTGVVVSWTPDVDADSADVRVDGGAISSVVDPETSVTGVPPGPHRLEVRSVNVDGVSAWVAFLFTVTAARARFPERVLAGLGETFRDRAGAELVDLVYGLCTAATATDDLLAPAASGFPLVLDLDESPLPAWLGQATGTPVPAGLSLVEARALIRDRPRWRRGTPAAMLAAIQAAIPGRLVAIDERFGGDAYALRVRVFDATGDELDKAETAALAHKPVGIVMTVINVAGATYQHMLEEHTPYSDFSVDFPSYAAATGHDPEGGTTP